MTISLDAIMLGVPEVPSARQFYASVLSTEAADNGDAVDLDIHGAGRINLRDTRALAAEAGAEPEPSSGFRGFVVSLIVNQPTEVVRLLEAAVHSGAGVLKPAKKGFWGGFSAAYQAPDGAIWTLTAPTKKDTGPASDPPVPTESQALLGVASPKDSREFYTALGLKVDRDYGNKYIDFHPAPGGIRLGLMTRRSLAKDANVSDAGAGFRAVVLYCSAGSRDEVDAVFASVASAGGRIVVPAEETARGYSGHFMDPDGFLWKVETRDK